VELDAATQLELPGLVVDGPPAFGQARDRLRVDVARHQRLEDVLGIGHVRREIEVMRIDRGIEPCPHRQIGRDRRPGHGGAERDRREILSHVPLPALLPGCHT
jgi:hypothetical protein